MRITVRARGMDRVGLRALRALREAHGPCRPSRGTESMQRQARAVLRRYGTDVMKVLEESPDHPLAIQARGWFAEYLRHTEIHADARPEEMRRIMRRTPSPCNDRP